MKTLLILLSALLFVSAGYPQTKRKSVKPSPKPIAKPTSISVPKQSSVRPPIEPCYENTVETSPMLGGVRLGTSRTAVTSKLKLEPVLDASGKPVENQWLSKAEGMKLQLLFLNDLLSEISADYPANGQFKNVDEFTSFINKKFGLDERWRTFDRSPRYKTELDRIDKESFELITSKLNHITKDPNTAPELIAIKKKQEALEQKKKELNRDIGSRKYLYCVSFEAYAFLVNNDLGIITITVKEK